MLTCGSVIYIFGVFLFFLSMTILEKIFDGDEGFGLGSGVDVQLYAVLGYPGGVRREGRLPHGLHDRPGATALATVRLYQQD